MLKGLRFVFEMSGKASRFSIVALLVAIGAGLGLLIVATIAADFVMAHVGRRYLPKYDISLSVPT